MRDQDRQRGSIRRPVLLALGLLLAVPAWAAGPFIEPEAVAIHTFSGEAVGDGFGWVAEAIGDIDDDGVSEVIIAAPFAGQNGPLSGLVYIYSGADGALLNAPLGEAFDQFGWSATRAGDVDADGVPDYAVGGCRMDRPGRV